MAKAQHVIPISADWIIKRILEGKKVRLKNAKIDGVIDLSKLDLPTKTVDRTDFQKNVLKLSPECKIVSSSIDISDSKFTGLVNFSNCIFDAISRFNGATFSEVAGFNGATFSEVAGFYRVTFGGYAWFNGAMFSKDAWFNGAMFSKDAWFYEVTFSKGAGFDGAMFSKDAWFNGATFNEVAWFYEATFSEDAGFGGATFSRDARFDRATFSKYARFNGATFKGNAEFDGATFSEGAGLYKATFSDVARFEGVTFKGIVFFEGCKFEVDFLTFRDAMFTYPHAQEEACRRAKNVLAKAGNRDEEEYHFYREMEAKRIQKGIRGNSGLGLGDCLKTDTWSFRRFFVHDVLEFIFVQKIFGYGVYPFHLFGWWLIFVVTFAIIFSVKGALEEPVARQWYDYLWFSIATAATPGYALYKPLGLFKFIAGIEAILGTFMWAAFITTFARKFSR